MLGDSGAAEKDHSRQETRKHQAYNREPQRMRQPDDAAQHRGHGVKRNAKQHSREDCHEHARHRELNRRGETLGNIRRNRMLRDDRIAHVASENSAEVVDVLDVERIVQAELTPN